MNDYFIWNGTDCRDYGIHELLSWAECFDNADIGTKHLIVSRLIERIDVSTGYNVHIKFKVSLKQFLGQE